MVPASSLSVCAQPCLGFCQSLVPLLVSCCSHTIENQGYSRQSDQSEVGVRYCGGGGSGRV